MKPTLRTVNNARPFPKGGFGVSPKESANYSDSHEISIELRDSQPKVQQSVFRPNFEDAESRGPSTARSDGKRKRHRAKVDDDLEGKYLDALAREESIEVKRQKTISSNDGLDHEVAIIAQESENDYDHGSEQDAIDRSPKRERQESFEVPQHESVSKTEVALDLEKSSRTVFLANVSTLAITSKSARKALLEHLTSIKSDANADDNVRVESLRFRSTAYASTKAPKKAAFVKKELMDATTRSTNAYVVYTNQMAARKSAAELNGTMVLDRHLRVDMVAHPAKIDHRRCVFIGNLGFVDDDTNVNSTGSEEKKPKPGKSKEPADMEEGLWRQFENAGVLESVRVVRDKITRVGKGFAYVQFRDANAVEKALLYDGKKFPPMLPRTLRVTRAKNVRKAANRVEKDLSSKQRAKRGRRNEEEDSSQLRSLQGRAGKLFGRAGDAHTRKEMRHKGIKELQHHRNSAGEHETVFEGYRASRLQGKVMAKSGKGQGKPRTRSSRRGADFKASGRKKART